MTEATLIIVCILFLACVWVIYQYIVVQPQRLGHYPKAAKENHYDRDYCNLLNAITKAKNLSEWKMARRQVARFRRQYKDGINSVSVENDVCVLNRHIEQVRIVLDTHPSTQLN